MRISKLFSDFFSSEKASGFILVACTGFSLLLTNSAAGEWYTGFWNESAGGHTLTHWINEGLMAVFFLLVALEIKREIYTGELKTFRQAILPVFAAAGGMLVPALIHFSLNRGTPAQNGFGIPMATDIAFALGVLSLAGKRIPYALKIFLTALAILDDLGAILLIAFFYSAAISWINLLIAGLIFTGILLLGRFRVSRLVFYLIPGIALWYFIQQSGVHATISGVLLAFAIPVAREGKGPRVAERLQQFLHRPVAFVVLPLFALANTGIMLGPTTFSHITDPNSLGIMLGLFIGKPVGIFVLSWIAVKSRLGRLPQAVSFSQIAGAGILGGIGFTMSIFMTLLAFPHPELIAVSKIAVLIASLFSGLCGLVFLASIKSRNPGTNLVDTA